MYNLHMKIINFPVNIILKYKPKRINRKCFQKFFSRELPYSKSVYLKYLSLYHKW